MDDKEQIDIDFIDQMKEFYDTGQITDISPSKTSVAYKTYLTRCAQAGLITMQQSLEWTCPIRAYNLNLINGNN